MMGILSEKEIEELLASLTESVYYYSESEIIGPFFTYNGHDSVELFGAEFSKYRYRVNKHRKTLCQNQDFISRLEDFMFGFSDVPIGDNDHVMPVHSQSHFWSEDKSSYEEGRSNIKATKEVLFKGAKFVNYQRQQLLAIIRILNDDKLELQSSSSSDETKDEYFKLEPNIKKVTAFKLALSAFFETCLHEDYSKSDLAKFCAEKFKLKDEFLGTESLRIALGEMKKKKLTKKDFNLILDARGLLQDAIDHLDKCQFK